MSKLVPACVLIPHAGLAYGQFTRQKVWEQIDLKSVTRILYVAALHHPLPDQDEKYGVYVQLENFTFPTPSRLPPACAPLSAPLPAHISKEHSYQWVKAEIDAAFPNAPSRCILTPTQLADARAFGRWLSNETVLSPHTLVIFTADLTHGGSKTGLAYPQQLTRSNLEAPFLESLLHTGSGLGEKLDAKAKTRVAKLLRSVSDAPYAMAILAEFADRLKLYPMIIDYTDSHAVERVKGRQQHIDYYTVDPQPVEHLVSYVGAVWRTRGVRHSAFEGIEPWLALGCVKSILDATVSGSLDRYAQTPHIPPWSIWHTMQNGVFVSTEVWDTDKNDWVANACYGRYEDSRGESTAGAIVAAALDCPRDARDRWKRPYDGKQQLRYKVEVLQPQQYWKWIRDPARNLKDVFRHQEGKYGVLLQLSSGQRATYLPDVGREFQSLDEFMSSLSAKASGQKEAWRRATTTCGLYTTMSARWDARSEQLEILRK